VFHRDGQAIHEFKKPWAAACVAAGLYQRVKRPNGTERVVPDRLFHDLRYGRQEHGQGRSPGARGDGDQRTLDALDVR